MGKWRDLFERNLAAPPLREYEEVYLFGAPATSAQIDSVEQGLGFRLPHDVREMLTEFNGILRGVFGATPITFYFSVEDMLEGVPDYIREWDDASFTQGSQKVAYVCMENGFADLYGVVVEPFSGFQPGEIVMVDHDNIGSRNPFEKRYANLVDLILNGPK